MIISQRGLLFIEHAENEPLASGQLEVATLYEDSGGRPAIGYGCDLSPDEVAQYDGRGISPQQAEDLLKFRLTAVQALIDKNVTVPLTQGQTDALNSLIYNVGPGAKGIKSGIIELISGEPSTLLRLLNAGDYAGCSAQFLLWDHIDGQVSEGLLARRQGEQAMFNTPDATVYESSD
jgi:lysozyme